MLNKISISIMIVISIQIQDMLSNVLSTLSSIQSQNANANEELGAKLMAENH